MRARKFHSFYNLKLRGLIWCSFEQYPEDNAASLYGLPAQDTWGQDFPNFEYTSH
jgi:hypothetical protein